MYFNSRRTGLFMEVLINRACADLLFSPQSKMFLIKIVENNILSTKYKKAFFNFSANLRVIPQFESKILKVKRSKKAAKRLIWPLLMKQKKVSP